jgi:TRAP-type transport system periplasmic protein
MILSRRRLLAVGSSAVMGGVIGAPFVARAQSAEFTYKYANNLPVSHPMNMRAREMADAITAETNGRVEINIFPSSQLGSDTDTLSQVRSGGVELFTLSGLILSTLVPAASINGVGYAFPDYDAVWKAMDGDLGAYVRAQIAKANLVAMDKIWDNGFRQTTSSTKPINTPDDLKGFKIRVPVSPLWTSMYKAFEAAPTSINFNEVYSSLQTKVVDGQENPLAIVSTAKL